MTKKNCPSCEAENSIDNKYCKECGFELPKVELENSPIEKTESKGGKKKILSIIVGIITFGV
ncbi:MAG: hypothetical protein K0B10_15870 [Vicingaceae bacterium]|nr:hypothetical protein [Vicingaceae bacterium]